MMVSLTLISIILIAAFAAFGNIGTLKNRIIGEVNLYEELYTASESIIDLVKKSGGIDYEEYFNRRLVGMTLSGGHYETFTGFGNYGNGGTVGTTNFGAPPYLCRSAVGSGDKMRNDGCYGTGALNTIGTDQR